MRLGVFGGTFDPIHLGHLIAAELAAELVELDQVLFVPAGQPWHRPRPPVASARDRLAMVQLAIAGNSRFEVSTVDLEREGPTYTDETLLALQRTYPAAQLVLLLGQDSLAHLVSWRRPERVGELAEIAAFARPDSPPIDFAVLEPVIPRARERIRCLATPLIAISASLIRERVRAGRSIRYLTPDPVITYIAAQGLYRA
jgi:nicotinate-nucleotide adenylyltransferase